MTGIAALQTTTQGRASPTGPVLNHHTDVGGTSETETESESDEDTTSDTSSSKSIPNATPSQRDGSVGASASAASPPRARPLFKMKRTGRTGLLQPSSSQHNAFSPRNRASSLKSPKSAGPGAADRHDEAEPEPSMITSDIASQITRQTASQGKDVSLNAGPKPSLPSSVSTPRPGPGVADEAERKRIRSELLSARMKGRPPSIKIQ